MTDTTNTATFQIKVLDIRTTTVGELTDVVKQVTWTIRATKDGIFSNEVQYTTVLADPKLNNYIPLQQLTEANVINFIETNDERLPGIKTYLQERLDVEIAKNTLTTAPLPWVSAVQSITSE